MTPAIDALRFVADELDPLYRPARFLLGYSHLARGDAAAAQEVFEQLTRPDAAAVGQAVTELRPLWINRRARLPRVAKRLPVIRRWLEYWKANVGYVTGGTLIIAAQAWAEIKEAEGDVREADAHFLLAMTRRFIDAETVRRAMAPASPEREDARRLLDLWLDTAKIHSFDSDLTMLSVNTLVRPFVDEDGGTSHGEFAARLADLRASILSRLFARELDAIEAAERARSWQTVRELIDDVKTHTVSQSDYHVARLLDDRSIDSLGATLALPFVPALRELRARRRALQQSLHTESVYHLAQAELISDYPGKLRRARRRARELREQRLPDRPRSGSMADLWLLTVCLEINCDARLLDRHTAGDAPGDAPEDAPEDDGQDRWRPTDAWYDVYTSRADLERALRRGTRSPAVRAALHTALGLADRIERLTDKRREREPRAWDFSRHTVYAEAAHYREALNLYETAPTHCYAAQVLLDMAAQEREVRSYAFAEARAHVERALVLSPLDSLARRLSADPRLAKTPATST